MCDLPGSSKRGGEVCDLPGSGEVGVAREAVEGRRVLLMRRSNLVLRHELVHTASCW